MSLTLSDFVIAFLLLGAGAIWAFDLPHFFQITFTCIVVGVLALMLLRQD